MPFVALHKDSGTRVCILDIENPRIELRHDEFACQSCGETLIVTGGFMRGNAHVRPYFRHKTLCDGKYDSHPESAEHLAVKQYVARHVHFWYGVNSQNIEVNYEYPISMDWRNKGRIADLMVEFKGSGIKDIHEVQLSPITLDDLIQRTEDYLRAGYFVWWYLGEKNDRPELRDYLFEHQANPFVISFKKDVRGQVPTE